MRTLARRAWLMPLIATAVLSAAPVSAQSSEFFGRLEADTSLAVRRGLDFLAREQNPDGSWTERIGRKVHYRYSGTIGRHVGVTALACMAFLSHGDTPGRGQYSEHLQRGLDFVLGSVQPNGFIMRDESRMYSHAFATLFLAEIYGMTGQQEVNKRLKESVNLIVQAQNEAGGWRYLPGAQDSDMSITVCQVMALRAARNAGIHVPKECIDSAIQYIKDSFVPETGAFYYQIERDALGRSRRSRTSFPLAAAGVTALFGAGEYEGEPIRRGLAFLRRERMSPALARRSFDYYYGMYYATQAAFQEGGEYWTEWYASVWPDLLGLQRPDGSWVDLVGANYATAMATIILQIPYQYLPIFER